MLGEIYPNENHTDNGNMLSTVQRSIERDGKYPKSRKFQNLKVGNVGNVSNQEKVQTL
uniref:Uncharacterized protein n=1 Tax=Rhizophora mucronata TaxID=61149 RepID=A0A2P2NE97_RHIMU